MQIYLFRISVYCAGDACVDPLSGGGRWGEMYADHRGGPKRSARVQLRGQMRGGAHDWLRPPHRGGGPGRGHSGSREREGLAARLWHQCLWGLHLMAVNTFDPAGGTYFAAGGYSSRIDFVHIPQGLRPHVVNFKNLPSAGNRSQAINTLDTRDNRPLYLDFQYTFEAQQHGRHTQDYDRIMGMLRGDEFCQNAVEHIHQTVLGIDEDNWIRLCSRPNSDEVWNTFASLVTQAARLEFEKPT
eukprot:8687870-Pyramimonas_sp.AAC.1